ncbi:hypothetical protein AAEP80_09815 [Curtobacterium sp. L3-7]|jgi:hypothetical protein|uniref:hypothetical protein n=1 Tax=Curtobacterium sp. L3-7 TaxID=3138787 RepID=UPI003B52D1D2
MSKTESGTEIHLVDEFSAATTDELAAAGPIRRVTGLVDQRLRFPHRGQLRLSARALELGDWRRLVPAEIERVERRYVPSYGRFAAGGVRGGFPSLAAARADGAPLVLDLRAGESIVLLVGFRSVSGLDHNRAALTALRRFIASAH